MGWTPPLKSTWDFFELGIFGIPKFRCFFDWKASLKPCTYVQWPKQKKRGREGDPKEDNLKEEDLNEWQNPHQPHYLLSNHFESACLASTNWADGGAQAARYDPHWLQAGQPVAVILLFCKTHWQTELGGKWADQNQGKEDIFIVFSFNARIPQQYWVSYHYVL